MTPELLTPATTGHWAPGDTGTGGRSLGLGCESSPAPAAADSLEVTHRPGSIRMGWEGILYFTVYLPAYPGPLNIV